LAELAAHNKETHEGKPLSINPKEIVDKTKPDPPPKPEFIPKTKPKGEPIVLEYKYKGDCESCGRAVDTITVEGKEKDTQIAYCSACKKQYNQVEVVPIAKQSKKK
jgi:hypothetical protein